MRIRSIHRVATIVALTLGTGLATRVNAAEEPSSDELARQIEALRVQVARLEAAQQKQEDKISQAEVDATVKSVLNDAERRSQLLQAQGFTAGYNNGKFIIQSEDGNFLFNPQIWFQARYIANYREEDAASPVDGNAATEDGFELRRVKFIFEGNVVNKDLKYRFQFNTNRSNGNAFLEDGYVSYMLPSHWGVRVGQFKEPTFHEELMSDVRQLAIERSLVNATLGGVNTDRVQGIAVIYNPGEDAPYRAEAGFTDGPNSKNTNFTDGGGAPFFGVGSPDFGLYARADYKLFGDWKSYDDFTSLNNKQDLLVIGAGASYSQAGDNNALLHTIDVQYEAGKLNAYGALYGAYSEQGESLYDYGALVQAGYLVTTKIEPFVRYEYIYVDDDGAGRASVGDDNFHVFAAGVNYYIKAHQLKLTVDASYLPNGTPINADGLGILDPDANDEQFVLRGQFQLLL